METNIEAIDQKLREILQSATPPLRVRKDSKENFEVAGTKEVMQGKQKVDGYYFASIVPKPKDIRLYFFPVYTHAAHYPELSPELNKCLKGKSCFHIKKLTEEMEAELNEMVRLGVELYQKDELI